MIIFVKIQCTGLLQVVPRTTAFKVKGISFCQNKCQGHKSGYRWQHNDNFIGVNSLITVDYPSFWKSIYFEK